MKYPDCYPGCGGEDCPCCEIAADHVAAARSIEDDFDPFADWSWDEDADDEDWEDFDD